ncbi:MAG: two-component system response regulator [Deltaproteobacteria bacterium HGW-Deltaproteobacteria-4]|nr:MAG: two-component system response regulator [Deltaproteobacteria bacterium HGW-Deltaproteobacteria-4]
METDKGARSSSILVVDDDKYVLETLLLLLSDRGYRVFTASNAFEALESLATRDVQIVLTDINMPEMDGIELAGRIHELHPDIPVLIMTGFAEVEVAVSALKRGAFDFIFKPINHDQLLHSLDKAAKFWEMKALEKNYRQELEAEVKKKTEELTELNHEVIHRLSVVAEYRDTDTGLHNCRIGRFSTLIATGLGLPSAHIEMLSLASSLHDIGKVAVPDSILLKPGALTAEEFAVIKSHTVIGAKMLGGSTHAILQMAELIALNHHERWDGGGYPNALQGEAIPIEGRIVMLADQYDALRAQRPYKTPYNHEEACRIILEGDGRTLPSHFDPRVLQVFRERHREFIQAFDALLDC